MPTIRLNKKHSKSPSEIRALTEQLAQLLQQKFQLKPKENNNTLTFKRLDMSGKLCLLPNEVVVTVKTGLLTGALTPVVEAELKQTLDKYLT
ncbi:MAG TPA: hypothetical protein DHT34_02000 [Cellvibrionales bacterium]|nr:hypothetical protein [Cellvibrionales bacterium]